MGDGGCEMTAQASKKNDKTKRKHRELREGCVDLHVEKAASLVSILILDPKEIANGDDADG